MKKPFLFIVPLLLLLLSACGDNSESVSTQPPPKGHVEYSYVEEFTTIDDVMRYSTNIVKAKLLSIEDFDGIVSVYIFDVSEDYTDNTPKRIHVYDAYNSAYIAGHTYYLFLESGESALYPHTIYTTVLNDFIIDDNSVSATTSAVNDHDITVSVSTIDEQIKSALSLNIVAKNIDGDVKKRISNSDSIKSISSSADVIAEVRLSNEANANMYASIYNVEIVSMVKGSATAISVAMNLPPNLSQAQTYYILLKESANKNGEYYLFSRTFPVISSTSKLADHLITE